MVGERTARILVADAGPRGHDRAAKAIAHALKNAGFEVIYTGLHQTVDMIAQTAMQEAVDVIVLSMMSVPHVPICRKLMALLTGKGVDDVTVLVRGDIQGRDVPLLNDMGVNAVFTDHSPADAPAAYIRAFLSEKNGTHSL